MTVAAEVPGALRHRVLQLEESQRPGAAAVLAAVAGARHVARAASVELLAEAVFNGVAAVTLLEGTRRRSCQS